MFRSELLHRKLNNRCARYLHGTGYLVITEMVLPNKKRADIVAAHHSGNVIICSTKTTKGDFTSDYTYKYYYEYCDEFYYVFYNNMDIANLFLSPTPKQKQKYKEKLQAGAIQFPISYNPPTILKESNLTPKEFDKDKMTFLIGRALSFRALFGNGEKRINQI